MFSCLMLLQISSKETVYSLTIPQCSMDENAEFTFQVGDAKCKGKITVEGNIHVAVHENYIHDISVYP